MRVPNLLATRNYLPKIALAVAVVLMSSHVRVLADTSSTPIVLELFTSEGCSSCPPADTFLRNLDSAQPLAGAQLIVLEEHVDYWDDQGWKDPFSSHEFTSRQTEYAQRLHVNAPYTPEMVVDGAYEFLGSDGKRADQVLNAVRSLPTVAIHISDIKVESGKVHAHIETGAVSSKAEVYVAIALDHAESQVTRGENGGHHLQHVAVVRSLTSAGKVSSSQTFSKDVILPDRSPGQPSRLIAFIQEPNAGKILGAAVEHFD